MSFPKGTTVERQFSKEFARGIARHPLPRRFTDQKLGRMLGRPDAAIASCSQFGSCRSDDGSKAFVETPIGHCFGSRFARASTVPGRSAWSASP